MLILKHHIWVSSQTFTYLAALSALRPDSCAWSVQLLRWLLKAERGITWHSGAVRLKILFNWLGRVEENSWLSRERLRVLQLHGNDIDLDAGHLITIVLWICVVSLWALLRTVWVFWEIIPILAKVEPSFFLMWSLDVLLIFSQTCVELSTFHQALRILNILLKVQHCKILALIHLLAISREVILVVFYFFSKWFCPHDRINKPDSFHLVYPGLFERRQL